jgi:hypothetical protein
MAAPVPEVMDANVTSFRQEISKGLFYMCHIILLSVNTMDSQLFKNVCLPKFLANTSDFKTDPCSPHSTDE